MGEVPRLQKVEGKEMRQEAIASKTNFGRT